MCQSRRTICYNRDTYHNIICLFWSIKWRRKAPAFEVSHARWDGVRPIKGNGTNLIVQHLTLLPPPWPLPSPVIHFGRKEGHQYRFTGTAGAVWFDRLVFILKLRIPTIVANVCTMQPNLFQFRNFTSDTSRLCKHTHTHNHTCL